LSPKFISSSTWWFTIFCFYIYTFFWLSYFVQILFIVANNYAFDTHFLSVYITQILVPTRHVLYTSKCCTTLESTLMNISSETTLSAVPQYCSLTSCYIRRDGHDNANSCSSADLECRCVKQLMKNIVKIVIYLKLFCCLTYLKSHTQYREMHVIITRGELGEM